MNYSKDKRLAREELDKITSCNSIHYCLILYWSTNGNKDAIATFYPLRLI